MKSWTRYDVPELIKFLYEILFAHFKPDKVKREKNERKGGEKELYNEGKRVSNMDLLESLPQNDILHLLLLFSSHFRSPLQFTFRFAWESRSLQTSFDSIKAGRKKVQQHQFESQAYTRSTITDPNKQHTYTWCSWTKCESCANKVRNNQPLAIDLFLHHSLPRFHLAHTGIESILFFSNSLFLLPCSRCKCAKHWHVQHIYFKAKKIKL